jgi:hypothetical protein
MTREEAYWAGLRPEDFEDDEPLEDARSYDRLLEVARECRVSRDVHSVHEVLLWQKDCIATLEAELAAAKRSMDCPLCGRLISAVLYEGTLGVVVFECGGCRMRLTSNCTRETWLSYPLAAARYPDAEGEKS